MAAQVADDKILCHGWGSANTLKVRKLNLQLISKYFGTYVFAQKPETVTNW
jgi:hypothetical protein